jgi:hypothetical protein
LKIVALGGKFLHQHFKGFLTQFFVAEFVSNLGIRSKKCPRTGGKEAKTRQKFKKYTICSKLSLWSLTRVIGAPSEVSILA